MGKQRKKESVEEQLDLDGANIRFIVPMPGKSSWHTTGNRLSLKKLHRFNDLAGDMALEDYQAQFLMQRDYLID